MLPFNVQPMSDIYGQTDGHGIFVDYSEYKMHVGTIIPIANGMYLLSIVITAVAEIPGYNAGYIDEVFSTMEAATDAARNFLINQYIT